MARKETIYTVSKETNTIIRASRTYLAAIEFSATLGRADTFLCTSEFQDLKKGDTISNIVSFL